MSHPTPSTAPLLDDLASPHLSASSGMSHHSPSTSALLDDFAPPELQRHAGLRPRLEARLLSSSRRLDRFHALLTAADLPPEARSCLQDVYERMNRHMIALHTGAGLASPGEHAAFEDSYVQMQVLWTDYQRVAHAFLSQKLRMRRGIARPELV